MSVADNVLTVAHAEINYSEGGGPHGNDGNITKYWSEMDPALQGQSWCAVEVSYVFKHAGFPLPAMDRPYGFMNCISAVNWAKANGCWDESGHYSPGDIILYAFGTPGVASHTGIVVDDDGSTIHTIEGNTSPGDAGSQTNGGGVYPRTRRHGNVVLGVVSLEKLIAFATAQGQPLPAPVTPPPAPPAAPPSVPAALDVDGDFGALTVKALQAALNAHGAGLLVDGDFGPASKRALQRYLGVGVDGDVGPQTIRALQAHVGARVDGGWGPLTTKALQRALNTGTF